MQRNKSVDIIRGIAILWIIIYHVYAIAASYGWGPKHYVRGVQELVMYGGEIGVTLFFIMSGYGIYCSLHRSHEKGDFRYGGFLKKRCARILPEYYVSLGIMLLFSGQAAMLSKAGAKHVLSHVFFVHNLFPETHGSINGVLWTMGTIVQFYLIAPLLYKAVKKNRYLALAMAVVITVASKYLLFHVFHQSNYFVYGRQLVSALDNFVIGMVIASFGDTLARKLPLAARFGGLAASVAALVAYLFYTNHITVYADSKTGYLWHSALALILGLAVLFAAALPVQGKALPAKVVLTVADHEYGIYLYHLVIIQNTMALSSAFRTVTAKCLPLSMLAYILLSVAVGIVSSKCISSAKH